jgi:hypothetical protein
MRPSVREFLANGVANFLNRLALSLVLLHRRDWVRALIAEQQEIKSSWERLKQNDVRPPRKTALASPACQRNSHER